MSYKGSDQLGQQLSPESRLFEDKQFSEGLGMINAVESRADRAHNLTMLVRSAVGFGLPFFICAVMIGSARNRFRTS